MPGEAQQVFFIGPQDRLVLLDILTGHEEVQMYDDIFGTVTHHHYEASLLFLIESLEHVTEA